ncbi:unnamed protein product [Phaeothamnion confervicola]
MHVCRHRGVPVPHHHAQWLDRRSGEVGCCGTCLPKIYLLLELLDCSAGCRRIVATTQPLLHWLLWRPQTHHLQEGQPRLTEIHAQRSQAEGEQQAMCTTSCRTMKPRRAQGAAPAAPSFVPEDPDQGRMDGDPEADVVGTEDLGGLSWTYDGCVEEAFEGENEPAFVPQAMVELWTDVGVDVNSAALAPHFQPASCRATNGHVWRYGV